MSWLELPDGSRMEIFGSGGGQAVSDALTRTLGARVPLLGQIPLDTRLREAGDAGAPIVLAEPDSPAAPAPEKSAEAAAVRRRGVARRSRGRPPVRRCARAASPAHWQSSSDVGRAAACAIPQQRTPSHPPREGLGPVLGIFAEPEEDGGDDQDGAVV